MIVCCSGSPISRDSSLENLQSSKLTTNPRYVSFRLWHQFRTLVAFRFIFTFRWVMGLGHVLLIGRCCRTHKPGGALMLVTLTSPRRRPRTQAANVRQLVLRQAAQAASTRHLGSAPVCDGPRPSKIARRVPRAPGDRAMMVDIGRA